MLYNLDDLSKEFEYCKQQTKVIIDRFSLYGKRDKNRFMIYDISEEKLKEIKDFVKYRKANRASMPVLED